MQPGKELLCKEMGVPIQQLVIIIFCGRSNFFICAIGNGIKNAYLGMNGIEKGIGNKDNNSRKRTVFSAIIL